MSGNQSKTTISRHFCSTVLRFYSTDVRKTLYNADFTKFSFASSFFVVLQHWCPENIVKRRFHEIFVRLFYVFATLMSGKHCNLKNFDFTMFSFDFSTFSQHSATDVRKTKQSNDFTHSEDKNEKRRRTWCAWQTQHDFETFREESKNRANAIGVSDVTFSKRKQRRIKYQKRRFRLRGVEKSSRSEVVKKSNQNEVEPSKWSELAETSEKT